MLRASLAAVALLAALPSGAQAADGYPGETLSLTRTSPAVAGAVTTFAASGQDLDAPSYAGGFNLTVYAKQPAAGTTCAASYADEQNNYIAALTIDAEKLVEVGGWEGADATPFSIPFKAAFTAPGPELLCGYSTWAGDTAAAATLPVTVTAPAPALVRRPSVRRSGKRLTCSPGGWSGAPRFAYAWRRDNRAIPGAHTSRLKVTRGLRGHTVSCRVIATNAGGSAVATSRGLRIH